NHAATVALYFMSLQLRRVHQTLRVTPAMEAGIADHVWSIEEIVYFCNDNQCPLPERRAASIWRTFRQNHARADSRRVSGASPCCQRARTSQNHSQSSLGILIERQCSQPKPTSRHGPRFKRWDVRGANETLGV